MIAPFLFGFGFGASVIAVLIGVVLFGLALQADGPRRSVSLTAHAGFDYALAGTALVSGIVTGFGTGDWNAGIFLVGVGAAMAALTASTRFTTARSV